VADNKLIINRERRKQQYGNINDEVAGWRVRCKSSSGSYRRWGPRVIRVGPSVSFQFACGISGASKNGQACV